MKSLVQVFNMFLLFPGVSPTGSARGKKSSSRPGSAAGSKASSRASSAASRRSTDRR